MPSTTQHATSTRQYANMTMPSTTQDATSGASTHGQRTQLPSWTQDATSVFPQAQSSKVSPDSTGNVQVSGLPPSTQKSIYSGSAGRIHSSSSQFSSRANTMADLRAKPQAAGHAERKQAAPPPAQCHYCTVVDNLRPVRCCGAHFCSTCLSELSGMGNIQCLACKQPFDQPGRMSGVDSRPAPSGVSQTNQLSGHLQPPRRSDSLREDLGSIPENWRMAPFSQFGRTPSGAGPTPPIPEHPVDSSPATAHLHPSGTSPPATTQLGPPGTVVSLRQFDTGNSYNSNNLTFVGVQGRYGQYASTAQHLQNGSYTQEGQRSAMQRGFNQHQCCTQCFKSGVKLVPARCCGAMICMECDALGFCASCARSSNR